MKHHHCMVRGQSIPGDACSNRLLFGEIERGGLRTVLVVVGLYVWIHAVGSFMMFSMSMFVDIVFE